MDEDFDTLKTDVSFKSEPEENVSDSDLKSRNSEVALGMTKERHNSERTIVIEKHTPEFKVDAVKRVREIGLTEAAKQLFVAKSTLKRWTRYITNPLYCSFCGKGFGEQTHLKRHEEAHQNQKIPTPMKDFQCDKCCKIFACSSDLQFACRLKSHRQACPGKEGRKKKRLQKRNHQCDKCSQLFSRPNRLNRHLKVCSGSNSKTYQYQCRVVQYGGGWGGTLPHPGVVPPHEDLSPPIPKILSPPPR